MMQYILMKIEEKTQVTNYYELSIRINNRLHHATMIVVVIVFFVCTTAACRDSHVAAILTVNNCKYSKLAYNIWACYDAKLCEAEIAYRTANSNPNKYMNMPICICTHQKDKLKADSNDLNYKLSVSHVLTFDMNALKPPKLQLIDTSIIRLMTNTQHLCHVVLPRSTG
jgi:hypothetical protein